MSIICSVTMLEGSYLRGVTSGVITNPNVPNSIKIHSPGLQDLDGFRTKQELLCNLTQGLMSEFCPYPKEYATV